LLLKLGLTKKNPPRSFPNCMFKNTWIKYAFPYAPLPHHKRAKANTIGVIRRASVKLPHHKGIALTYLMENEMSFVCHVIE
jgi:hypothetical protein